MNTIELPAQFSEPTLWVSVLVSSYNTKHKYVQECLESIKDQQGHFGIELVWVNDGSNEISTRLLEKTLDTFKISTRFCRIVYTKMETNKGISYCLNKGIVSCSNEIIVKQDSDDISLPNRIVTQLEFLSKHPDCILLGSNVTFFQVVGQDKRGAGKTNHPSRLTWSEYKAKKPYSHWIMNHPSIMFKRSAALAVGNYSLEPSIFEDFELELKILKTFGVIYNISDSLVLYRLHPEQVTYGGKPSTPDNMARKNAFIESLISPSPSPSPKN